MIKKLMIEFGYDDSVILMSNNRKNCGLWLVLIGFVMIFATLMGGTLMVNPFVFVPGYALGFYFTHINQKIFSKLSMGEMNVFQERMAFVGLASLGIFTFMLGGPFFIGWQWRNIWLGAMLASGIHFLFFYYIHGKSMVVLSALSIVVAVAGFYLSSIPFSIFGILDGGSKIIIGSYLLIQGKPVPIC